MDSSESIARKNKIQNDPTPTGKSAILSYNIRLLINPPSASHPLNKLRLHASNI